MTTIRINRSADGFSLLEVLVAVVIVSIGLVALAALQLSLIRSSNTAKMQTTALSLAKQKVEQLRSFRQLSPNTAGTTGINNPCNSLTNTSYIKLDSCVTSQAVGGVTYSVATTITRYVLDDATYSVVGNTATEASLKTDAGHKYVLGRDFKKANVKVTWTDATNASNALALDDVVDGLDPVDSAKVAQNSSNLATRPVQVIINNPSATAGVIAIPLATGDAVDTAATNPKPVLNSNGAETRFNILTFAGLTSTTALAQSQVETVLIGCTCDTATADSTARGYRPTYWNGLRYVPPTLATYASPAGQPSTKKSTESPYCGVCCRDHNDPVGITTAKFSPFRASHTHYGFNSSNQLVPVGTDGVTQYVEACRLIRTDGIFRVAADYNDEYFNLLKTGNDGTKTSTDYGPDSTAVGNYQNFVLDYLKNKVVNNTAPSTYNSAVAPSIVALLESTYSINDPPFLKFANRTSSFKWLHSRGLYIDYLEPEALQAIADAKANCVTTGCSAAAKQTAILELMPFTTINVTELTNWKEATTDAGSYITVTDNAFNTSIAGAPVRGYTVPAATGIPTGEQSANAVGVLRNSNSGLQAQYDYAINFDDGDKSDTQLFKIPDESTASSISFNVSTNTYTMTALRPSVVGNSVVSGCKSVRNSGSYSIGCGANSTSLTLAVTGYNYDAGPSGANNLTLTCTQGASTSQTYVASSSDKVQVCKNFKLNSIKNNAGVTVVSNSAVGSGLTQTTSTDFNSTPVANGDTLILNFSPLDDTYSYTCIYTGSSPTSRTVTINPKACP